LLYSGDLTDELVVAGTVFRSVLIWHITSGQLLRRLEGHTGVIFDVTIIANSVASVSDDRSVRFWPEALTDSYINQQSVMYGHTARVWKVLNYGEGKLVTCSEDTTVRVWDIETSECIRVM
jgi:WD40 repeat protein